jgi:hypothetical protein
VWGTPYFSRPDPSSWPGAARFNGTNLLLQGCNILSVPIKVDSASNAVQLSLPDLLLLTRKACGDLDQPYIDLLGRITRVQPLANSSAILLNFYDQTNSKVMALDRIFSSQAEQDGLVFVTASQSGLQPAASPQNSQNSSRQNQNSLGSSGSTGSGATAQSQSGMALVDAQRLIVGIYNPTKVYTQELPSAIYDRIRFVLTLDSLSITGLCNVYKYPLTISEQGGVISFKADPSRKLSQSANQGCDPQEDLLYLNPLEAAATITMVDQQGQVLAFLSDAAKRQVLELRRMTAQ